jgi:hypothetical protein
MIIILPLLRDPTDIIVQGEQLVYDTPPVSILNPILQGQVIGNTILSSPIPVVMVGQSELYAVPTQIGPKVMSGGEVVMIDVGTKTANPFVDSTQKWLNSMTLVDATGFRTYLEADLLGAMEANYFTNRELIGDTDNSLLGMPTMYMPRTEINASGLAKRVTSSNLPASFMTRSLEPFIDSTEKWFITGTTMDSNSSPVANCRVIVLLTYKIKANSDNYGNPIIGETVSDTNGCYSLQVVYSGPYQVIAYLPGSPDLAGVTVNSIIPTEG